MSAPATSMSGSSAPGDAPAKGSRGSAEPPGLTLRPSRAASAFVVLLLIFTAALAVRISYPVPGAFFDEFYHFVPAQSVLDGNGTTMGGGEYNRAKLFTYAVAGSMAVFGETLWAARLPSVIFGAAMVALAGVWVYRRGGLLASMITSVALTCDPALIAYSTFCRFYTMQATCVLLVMMAVWELLETPMSHLRRGLLVVGAGLVALLALHLQSSSAVPFLAVGLWFVGVMGWRALHWNSPAEKKRNLMILVGGVLLMAGGAAFVLLNGWLEHGLRLFRHSPAWGNEWASDPTYYHQRFFTKYGWLWLLMPLLTAAAWAAAGRLAVYLTLLLFVGLGVHSFGATKDLRFITWMFPVMGMLIGLGCAKLLPPIARIAGQGLAGLFGASKWADSRTALAGGWAIVVFAGLGQLYYSPMVFELRSMARGAEHTLNRYASEDWRPIRPMVENLLTDETVLVSASGPRMIAYFGRLDYTILATEIERFENGEPDHRTGAIGAASLEHMQAAVDRHRRGVVVIEEKNWREKWGVTEEIADWIEAHLVRIETPSRSRVHLFIWDRARDAVATAPSSAPATRGVE